jgi:pimeloyl-ACP methyl ester carboxylesterase
MWKGFCQIMWPMTMYRWFPSAKRLHRFVEPLMTTLDDEWVQYMGDAVRDVKMDLRIPPLAKPEMFDGYTIPTLVFTGDQDLSFPGTKLINRVKELIPHAETELIANCRHCPPNTDDFRSWISKRIVKFLDS